LWTGPVILSLLRLDISFKNRNLRRLPRMFLYLKNHSDLYNIINLIFWMKNYYS
jgi:hypothetical protein